MESQANKHIVLKGCEKKYRIRHPQHDFVIRSAEREYGSSHPPRNEDVMAGEKKTFVADLESQSTEYFEICLCFFQHASLV